MRDDVTLSVDIYRPDDGGRHPAILVHTPYNNNNPGLTERARWFARRGYAVVMLAATGRTRLLRCQPGTGKWDVLGR